MQTQTRDFTDRTIRTNINCRCLEDVLRVARAGKAFKAYVTFRGWTDKGNRSSKFWEITGRGYGPVTVRWGRIGTPGRSQVIGYGEATSRLMEKSGKGYRF
jgi:predicted DNA-binding WGR domain protein